MEEEEHMASAEKQQKNIEIPHHTVEAIGRSILSEPCIICRNALKWSFHQSCCQPQEPGRPYVEQAEGQCTGCGRIWAFYVKSANMEKKIARLGPNGENTF